MKKKTTNPKLTQRRGKLPDGKPAPWVWITTSKGQFRPMPLALEAS